MDINTFLLPFIEEMMLLQKGIPNVWDGYRKEYFTLRAHVCLVTGDMKAREKLIQSTGWYPISHANIILWRVVDKLTSRHLHVGCNSLSYCSYCKIRSIRGEVYNTGHNYCAFTPPKSRPDPTKTKLSLSKRPQVRCVYRQARRTCDPSHLPKKNHVECIDVMNILMDNMNHKWASQHDVRGFSVFSALWSVNYPRSFPMDSMHQWYNFFKYLYSWFRGKFKAEEQVPVEGDAGPEGTAFNAPETSDNLEERDHTSLLDEFVADDRSISASESEQESTDFAAKTDPPAPHGQARSKRQRSSNKQTVDYDESDYESSTSEERTHSEYGKPQQANRGLRRGRSPSRSR